MSEEILLESELKKSIRRVLAYIKSLGIDKALTSTDRVVLFTRMQIAFKAQPHQEIDRSIYELIMTSALAAEKLGPGGFKRCIELLSMDAHAISTPREVHAATTTLNDIESLISQYSSSALISGIVSDATRLAGFAGRIIVEKTSSLTPSVELVRGYTFQLQSLLNIDASFTNPRIVCIDGIIESVSEIHHLLEAISEAKEPCLLFVRGISDDVKQTLRVNYDRGSLKVLPIGVRFDLDGMNTLVDIATVSGANLVSSLKGELISAIKFNEQPIVEQVTVFKGKVVISHTKTRKSVSTLVMHLRERRNLEQIDDVGKLLDNRIRSLSPNHVVIRLPDDKDFVVRSQSIDYALRAVRSSVDHGLIDGRLASTEMASGLHAKRCMQMLSSLGAYVKA